MAQAKCKKYDLSGSEVAEVALEYDDKQTVKAQLVKDYILALRKNARQWSANTKSRSESNHSNAKPHAQKGTGKARQGFLGAPQYKGGGRVHTPKPKFDQHVKINQKERRAAIRHLLTEKIREGNLVFLNETFEKDFLEPKTKKLASFIEALGWGGQRVICLGGEETSPSGLLNFKKSLRNLPNFAYLMTENVNGYDVMVGQKIIVVDTALETLERLLRGEHAKK